MKFAMPYGETMEIRPSKPIDEDEVGIDEEVEGVVYQIFWNEKPLPWCTNTRLQATAIALGCQWGALEIYNRKKNNGW
jgi:hypothetical protein